MLAHHFTSALETLFSQLAGRPKQLDVLMRYLQRVPVYQNIHANHRGFSHSMMSLKQSCILR